MSVARVNFFSKSVNMRIDVMVILPEYPRQREAGRNFKEKYPSNVKFPVIYFLNGFTGDYTDGLTMIPMERYAQETGLAVVIPSGLNSWYEDIPGGPHMQTFIAEELPAAMEAMFPLADTADRRFIAGLSMGGRGAAIISAKYHREYRAAVCLSAPLCLSDMLKAVVGEDRELLEKSLDRALGGSGKLTGEENDYGTIVKQVLKKNQMIPEMLYLFGKEDLLYKGQYETFAAFVTENNLPIRCEAWENGRHDFDFWEPAMRSAMAWIMTKLSI